MAFPATLSDARFELDLVGDWSAPEDITQWVRTRDPVTITRGRSAESVVADPSSCSLTVDNRDGRFSPRNPTGPYYGKLGRNTAIRVSVIAGSVRSTATAGAGNWSAPDSAGTSITGDIDVRVDLRPAAGWRFRPGTALILARKWGAAGQRSWHFELSNDGKLRLFWSPDGTASPVATSTAPVPLPVVGRKAARVTLDVNNGAAGNTVTFYTAPTIAGPWTQVGDPVVQAGVTSIFDSTTATTVDTGDRDLYAAEIRNGIGGSLVASPTFTAQSEGTVSFADAQGNTWTASASTVRVTARRYRHYGAVSEWPVKWHRSGQDVYVPITAAGVLRRLGQGASPLRSTLQRGVLSLGASLVAYWPAEDGDRSTSIASALGGPPMSLGGAPPSFGVYNGFAATGSIPTLSGSSWLGDVPVAAAGTIQARTLMAVPAAGETNGAIPFRVWTTGSARRWDLGYGTGGSLSLKSYDSAGTLLQDSGPVAFAVNGRRLLVSIELVQNGANVDWRFATLEEGAPVGAYTAGTLTGNTVGRAARVQTNPLGILTDTAMGHVYVQSVQTSIFDLDDQLAGFAGETAGTRVVRLCGEEGLPVYVVGDPADSAPMGPQRPATLLELLRECAATDQGVLFEPRHTAGLAYRTRVALHNQTPALALEYRFLDTLTPVDDDQQTRNDITVTRDSGSSYRATLSTGPLSTQDPPAGVGRYVEQLLANPADDGQLPDLAGWRLALGTVDEARYPALGLNLAKAVHVDSPTRTAGVLDTDVGDRVVLTGLPAWLPPGDVTLLVRGSVETLGPGLLREELACDPGSLWTVGVWDDPAARYSSDGSTLGAPGLTTTATSMPVVTPSGPLWTTAPADYPLDVMVGGERMTVTAMSGAASPQTATVTRSVNGVVKTHSAGEAVALAAVTRYAI